MLFEQTRFHLGRLMESKSINTTTTTTASGQSPPLTLVGGHYHYHSDRGAASNGHLNLNHGHQHPRHLHQHHLALIGDERPLAEAQTQAQGGQQHWALLDASQVMQLEAHQQQQQQHLHAGHHHSHNHHLHHYQQPQADRHHHQAVHQTDQDQYIFAPLKQADEYAAMAATLHHHHHPLEAPQPAGQHYQPGHQSHHHLLQGCQVCLAAGSYQQVIPVASTATVSPRSIVRNVSELRLTDEQETKQLVGRSFVRRRRKRRTKRRRPPLASPDHEITTSAASSQHDSNCGNSATTTPTEGPTTSSKEMHNEIERRRRLRIKRCCELLKTMIPNLSRKLDKASILEQTVRYVRHLTGCPQNRCVCLLVQYPVMQ